MDVRRNVRREIAIDTSSVSVSTPVTKAPQAKTQAQLVHLDFLVAALDRPHVERAGRDLIDEWNGDTESGQIDGLEIAPARVAGVDAKVVELGGDEIAELALIFFGAVRAEDPPPRPVRRARRADEGAAARIRGAVAAQHGELRRPAAEGARVATGRDCEIAVEGPTGRLAGRGEMRERFGIGLQHEPREKGHRRRPPALAQQAVERGGVTRRVGGSRRRSDRTDGRERPRRERTQRREIALERPGQSRAGDQRVVHRALRGEDLAVLRQERRRSRVRPGERRRAVDTSLPGIHRRQTLILTWAPNHEPANPEPRTREPEEPRTCRTRRPWRTRGTRSERRPCDLREPSKEISGRRAARLS
jgi:hypothetical protein